MEKFLEVAKGRVRGSKMQERPWCSADVSNSAGVVGREGRENPIAKC